MLAQSIALVPVAGVLAFILAHRGLASRERKFVRYAFVAHVLGSIALVAYHEHVFRGGDMYLYTAFGQDLAAFLRFDFVRWGPEVVKLTLQKSNDLPVSVVLEGTSTATMMGLTSFVMVAFGDSVYGSCLIFSFFSFYGTVSMYRAVRGNLGRGERAPVLLGTLLVPSVVFWTSGIVKEAVVLGALGIVLEGLAELGARRLGMALVRMPAVGLIMLVKPYVLVPLVLASGAWFYAGRRRKTPFVYKLVGACVAVGGFVAITTLLPAYSLERVGETIATTQQNFAQANEAAGSGVQIGDPDMGVEEQTLSASLKWLPLALLNALARPMLFDVRNIATAVAAVEMTVLAWIVLSLLYKYGLIKICREVISHRPFLFAAVFVLTLGASVGLATANLGTLSRYRVPMMPMYVATALALRARLDERTKRERGTQGSKRTQRRGLALVSGSGMSRARTRDACQSELAPGAARGLTRSGS